MFSHGMEYAFLNTIRLRTSSFGREVDTFGTSDLDYQQDLCTGRQAAELLQSYSRVIVITETNVRVLPFPYLPNRRYRF